MKRFGILLGLFLPVGILFAGQAPSGMNKLKVIFHFNEVAGTVVYDSVGISTASLKNGATLVTGRFGNAVACDGVNDYVEVGPNNIFNLQAPFSIAAWVFPKGTSADGFNCVLCANGIRMGLYYNGTYQVALRHYDAGVDDQDVAPSTTAIQLYQWTHIAATKDADTFVRLYVNGKLVLKDPHVNLISYVQSNSPNYGMCSPDGTNFLLNGIIDDLVVSTSAALTDGEVKKLFSTGVGVHQQNEEK